MTGKQIYRQYTCTRKADDDEIVILEDAIDFRVLVGIDVKHTSRKYGDAERQLAALQYYLRDLYFGPGVRGIGWRVGYYCQACGVPCRKVQRIALV